MNGSTTISEVEDKKKMSLGLTVALRLINRCRSDKRRSRSNSSTINDNFLKYEKLF